MQRQRGKDFIDTAYDAYARLHAEMMYRAANRSPLVDFVNLYFAVSAGGVIGSWKLLREPYNCGFRLVDIGWATVWLVVGSLIAFIVAVVARAALRLGDWRQLAWIGKVGTVCSAQPTHGGRLLALRRDDMRILYEQRPHEVCANPLDLRHVSPVGNPNALRDRINQMHELTAKHSDEDAIGVIHVRDLTRKLKNATTREHSLVRVGKEAYAIRTAGNPTAGNRTAGNPTAGNRTPLSRFELRVLSDSMNVACGPVKWGSDDAKSMILGATMEPFLSKETAHNLWFAIGAREEQLDESKWASFSRAVQFMIMSQSTIWPSTDPPMYVQAGSEEARALVAALGATATQQNDIVFLAHADDPHGLDEWFYRNPDAICDRSGAAWYNLEGAQGIHPDVPQATTYHDFLTTKWGVDPPARIDVTLRSANDVLANYAEVTRSREQVRQLHERLKRLRGTMTAESIHKAMHMSPERIAEALLFDPTFLAQREANWPELERVGVYITKPTGLQTPTVIHGSAHSLQNTQVYGLITTSHVASVLQTPHAALASQRQQQGQDTVLMDLEPQPVRDSSPVQEHPLFQRVLMFMGDAIASGVARAGGTAGTERIVLGVDNADSEYTVQSDAKFGNALSVDGGSEHEFTVVPTDYVTKMNDWTRVSMPDDAPDHLRNPRVDDVAVCLMSRRRNDPAKDWWLHGCFWNMPPEHRAALRQLVERATAQTAQTAAPTGRARRNVTFAPTLQVSARSASIFVLRRLAKAAVRWPDGASVKVMITGADAIGDTNVSALAMVQAGIVNGVDEAKNKAEVLLVSLYSDGKNTDDAVVVKLSIDTISLTRSEAILEAPDPLVSNILNTGPRLLKSDTNVIDPMTYGDIGNNPLRRDLRDDVQRGHGGSKYAANKWYLGATAIVRCVRRVASQPDQQTMCLRTMRADYIAMLQSRLTGTDLQTNRQLGFVKRDDLTTRGLRPKAQDAVTALFSQLKADVDAVRRQKDVKGWIDWFLPPESTVDGTDGFSALIWGVNPIALEGLKAVSTVQNEEEQKDAQNQPWYQRFLQGYGPVGLGAAAGAAATAGAGVAAGAAGAAVGAAGAAVGAAAVRPAAQRAQSVFTSLKDYAHYALSMVGWG